jgi:hypothetical protein
VNELREDEQEGIHSITSILRAALLNRWRAYKASPERLGRAFARAISVPRTCSGHSPQSAAHESRREFAR